MPQEQIPDNTPKPEWWDSKPDNDTKLCWQQAVEDYLEYEEEDAEAQVFSMDLVKDMLQSVAVRDKRWKKFPKKFFDITAYKGHRQLYDCIRNKLDSLKHAEEQKRKQAEEDAAAEKLKAETNERLEAEHKEIAKANQQLAKNERPAKQT